MADIHYYVSAQHGNDLNTGLSEAQAWATLTKAAQTVGTPAVGNNHIIVWGPGTYREKLTFAYGGRSANERIIYRPDPDGLYLTQDKPGRCRVTGADANEMVSAGDCVNFNSKGFVQFGDWGSDCWVDGVSGMFSSIIRGTAGTSWCVRVNVQNSEYVGILNSVAYHCRAYACVTGFVGCECFNCMSTGCRIGIGNSVSHNCTVIGGHYGFQGTNQSDNCTASGAFQGFASGTHSHGIASACSAGYAAATVYDCMAVVCSSATTGTINGDGSVAVGAVICCDDTGRPWQVKGVKGLGTTTAQTPAAGIDGRPRPDPPSIGAYEPPDMEPDWAIYKTTAPSIRLKGHSMHLMHVPAKGGEPITVKWWVQHHGTNAGKLPQIWLRHPGARPDIAAPYIATQITTHTGTADTWQELSVTVTPTRDQVLEVCLFSRDTAAGSYSVFSDPAVS